MNIEDIRAFALSLNGVTEDMPYGIDWLIFRIGGKIFLHIWLEAPAPTCAVKLKPEYGEQLREQTDGVRAAYHLNKKHWNDLYLDVLDRELIEQLITHSYNIVLARLPRKLRAQFASANPDK